MVVALKRRVKDRRKWQKLKTTEVIYLRVRILLDDDDDDDDDDALFPAIADLHENNTFIGYANTWLPVSSNFTYVYMFICT